MSGKALSGSNPDTGAKAKWKGNYILIQLFNHTGSGYRLIMEGENTKQTIGEHRVRTEFNPANNDVVSQIKQKSAELINLCEELKSKDGRLASLAQTTYEEAAMWAVKAATAER